MIRQITILATYIVLEAFRTYFFAVIAILLIVGFGLTLFLGQIAITETGAIKNGLLAAFLRLSAVYSLSLFVITSMVHEFNDQSITLWLAFPMRRSTYFFGKLCGFLLISSLTALCFGAALLNTVPFLQIGLWTFSLLCELLIIVSLSLLCVLTFHHTTQAFSAVLGFYIIARSINAIRLLAEEPIQNTSAWSSQFINGFVELLAMLLPDLDSFTQTEWLVYHTGDLETFLTIFSQTVIYGSLLITMSLFDFYRKNL